MPNIAQALKQEIARIARKEMRGDTTPLKKSSARYRSEIASLKRQMQQLERQIAALKKRGFVQAKPSSEPAEGPQQRFRADGLASHRKRLGLSAREAAQLLGVSQLTVFKWEKGQTHPRASQMPSIAAFRKLGRREAAARLQS